MNCSPSEAIRSARLERARQMLATRSGTVSEIACAVGVSSPHIRSTARIQSQSVKKKDGVSDYPDGALPSALILVDVQQGLDDPAYGRRNNPDAERNIAVLLTAFRSAGWAVIHIRHDSTSVGSPLRPGQPGNRFKPEAVPLKGEPVLEKHVSSAFLGTGLEGRLRSAGIERVVIAGLTTNHCVSSTARMAADLGFGVTVVSDATAAHQLDGPDGHHRSADDIHGAALASLNGEFGAVLSTDELLRQLRLNSE